LVNVGKMSKKDITNLVIGIHSGFTILHVFWLLYIYIWHIYIQTHPHTNFWGIWFQPHCDSKRAFKTYAVKLRDIHAQTYSMSWSEEEISEREVSEFQNSPTWNSNRLQKDCICTDWLDSHSQVVNGCFLSLMAG
jgi:hypothetical protein